jgi:hypothetical protein
MQASSSFYLLVLNSIFRFGWAGLCQICSHLTRRISLILTSTTVNATTAILIDLTKRAHKIAIALLTFTAVVFESRSCSSFCALDVSSTRISKIILFTSRWGRPVLSGFIHRLVAVSALTVISLNPSAALATAVNSYFWQMSPLWDTYSDSELQRPGTTVPSGFLSSSYVELSTRGASVLTSK